MESTRRGQPSVWVARGELPQTDLAVWPVPLAGQLMEPPEASGYSSAALEQVAAAGPGQSPALEALVALAEQGALAAVAEAQGEPVAGTAGTVDLGTWQ